MRPAYFSAMDVPADPTEQLLQQLEPQLAEKQAKVDARLAREKAAVDELTGQQQQMALSAQRADAEFERLAPLRDAAVQERDALAAAGSKGNKARAAFWSTVTMGCALGTMVPLFGLMEIGSGALVVPAFGAAAAGAVAGFITTALVRRWLR